MELKDKIEKAKQTFNETGENIGYAVRKIDRGRVDALKEAVENGLWKKYLIGAGMVGAGLVYNGLTNDDGYATGIGSGMLVMTALNSLPYILRPFERFRTRDNERNSQLNDNSEDIR